MTSVFRYLWCSLLATMLVGCSTYHPVPLDRSAVALALRPPSMEIVRIQAKTIKHPVLKPLDFDDRDGLSPDEAAILAVVANPVLRAIRDQKGIAVAQLLQAGILPNPQLSYSLEVPTGGDMQNTVNAFGLGLGWDISSLIALSAKLDAARAHAVSVDLDMAWHEWQVAQAAKLHVFRLVSIERQLILAKEMEKGIQEYLAIVKQAVDLGEKILLDLAAAKSALQQARISVLTIKKERERERLTLNRLLGLPPDRSVSLQRDIKLPSWQTLPSPAKVMDGIEEWRLDLLALKMGYKSQEARLRAAIRSQFPRISIGFSHARDTDNVQATGFGITIDLPFFDRNQGRIAIERATRKQLFDEYMARLFEARSEVRRILADMECIKRQISATEESIATLERLARIYHKALQEGNADILSYYKKRATLSAERIQVLKSDQKLADLGIALEIATGRYFPTCEAPLLLSAVPR